MTDGAKKLVGIDVGGTFTDIFVFDQDSGSASVLKVASTRGQEADGFMRGVQGAVEDLSGVAAIIHGTTVGTNALLERKGARTGLITTEGFRDVLQMRRRDRPTTWGLWGQYQPVVSRGLSRDVRERTLADGTQHTPLDEACLRYAAEALLRDGAEALALVFVNAYANDAHERRAAEILRGLWPNAHVSVSSELLPEIREFERASTTALNAYLQPAIGDYLTLLGQRLVDGGFAGEFLIMQSNGGVFAASEAANTPVRTALSGPAAGVYASAHIAGQAGFDNVITCDMGGTSFDISVVADGEPALAAQTSVDFGLVIRSPMIEITTIGAGGGSIAQIDAGEILQIGPESAGSVPGPVCYGLGGDRPTVTDANVVLGRINAENPIGGQLDRLDVAAARAAIETHVAGPLGLDVAAAAEAITDVANARMAGAIRLVSIERGHDPRVFSAMPFGGGGALHACALVREIGLASALVPRYPGIVSALGCVIADMRQDFVRTINRPLADTDIDDLRRMIDDLATTGAARLAQMGARFDGLITRVVFDMLYAGQTHTIDVAYSGAIAEITHDTIQAAFEARYKATYGGLLDAVPQVLTNLRVAVIGTRPKFDLGTLAPAPGLSPEAALIGSREVYMGGAWQDAPVMRRLDLPVGARITGPAVLEQPDTTIWIEPGFTGEVDRFGNLVITPET